MKTSDTSEWNIEARRAIRMCEEWAANVMTKAPCQLFLFGSAIYLSGEQFDSEQSDLDIVCQLPDEAAVTAISRWEFLKSLFHDKAQLELTMIPTLSRTNCTEPGVSIVPVTNIEVRTDIHKSGSLRFFSKNIFYDLQKKEETLALHPEAGTRAVRYERRQALEYVQKIRNEYLSVSANRTGGIREFNGRDPMPKALCRAAAQLNTDANVGEWYDTRLGLELMFDQLRSRSAEDKAIRKLFDRLSVRRRGRGRERALSADDQLLLAELLFDLAATGQVKELITWEVRSPTKNLLAEVQRLVPDAHLTLDRTGLAVQGRSTVGSYQVLSKLQEHGVLASILNVDRAELVGPTTGEPPSADSDSREERLVAEISRWQPALAGEHEFMEFLRSAIERIPILNGASLTHGNQASDVSGLRYQIDFVLTWSDRYGKPERINIEFKRLSSRSSFFSRLKPMLRLGLPIIFVVAGDASILEGLMPDIHRLALGDKNIRVVPIWLAYAMPESRESTALPG